MDQGPWRGRGKKLAGGQIINQGGPHKTQETLKRGFFAKGLERNGLEKTSRDRAFLQAVAAQMFS
ncbi:hypothetical protein J3U88_24150 [Acanthopleuribacter pedis]|uniref:Uncharacterized protein n=1 Tax=Acanthopleuribacter pedis TaxID=442870 RepID=A0A8J7Q6S5_9BACT|nr:hypothetical protein [Acanthopleuribacter pedis]